jgi:hypothetical protein
MIKNSYHSFIFYYFNLVNITTLKKLLTVILLGLFCFISCYQTFSKIIGKEFTGNFISLGEESEDQSEKESNDIDDLFHYYIQDYCFLADDTTCSNYSPFFNLLFLSGGKGEIQTPPPRA